MVFKSVKWNEISFVIEQLLSEEMEWWNKREIKTATYYSDVL